MENGEFHQMPRAAKFCTLNILNIDKWQQRIICKTDNSSVFLISLFQSKRTDNGFFHCLTFVLTDTSPTNFQQTKTLIL